MKMIIRIEVDTRREIAEAMQRAGFEVHKEGSKLALRVGKNTTRANIVFEEVDKLKET